MGFESTVNVVLVAGLSTEPKAFPKSVQGLHKWDEANALIVSNAGFREFAQRSAELTTSPLRSGRKETEPEKSLSLLRFFKREIIFGSLKTRKYTTTSWIAWQKKSY